MLRRPAEPAMPAESGPAPRVRTAVRGRAVSADGDELRDVVGRLERAAASPIVVPALAIPAAGLWLRAAAGPRATLAMGRGAGAHRVPLVRAGDRRTADASRTIPVRLPRSGSTGPRRSPPRRAACRCGTAAEELTFARDAAIRTRTVARAAYVCTR